MKDCSEDFHLFIAQLLTDVKLLHPPQDLRCALFGLSSYVTSIIKFESDIDILRKQTILRVESRYVIQVTNRSGITMRICRNDFYGNVSAYEAQHNYFN
jgi:hypothetical protein